MPRLVALKEFPYRDKSLKVGDPFDAASDEDARLLKGFGTARDADDASSGSEDAVSSKGLFAEGEKKDGDEEQHGKQRRQYHRRDMVSEG